MIAILQNMVPIYLLKNTFSDTILKQFYRLNIPKFKKVCLNHFLSVISILVLYSCPLFFLILSGYHCY